MATEMRDIGGIWKVAMRCKHCTVMMPIAHSDLMVTWCTNHTHGCGQCRYVDFDTVDECPQGERRDDD